MNTKPQGRSDDPGGLSKLPTRIPTDQLCVLDGGSDYLGKCSVKYDKRLLLVAGSMHNVDARVFTVPLADTAICVAVCKDLCLP